MENEIQNKELSRKEKNKMKRYLKKQNKLNKKKLVSNCEVEESLNKIELAICDKESQSQDLNNIECTEESFAFIETRTNEDDIAVECDNAYQSFSDEADIQTSENEAINVDKQKELQNKKQEKEKQRALRKREKSLRKQKAQELREIREQWYKLDNSALLYPAICNEEWNSVFRISAIMKKPVNKDKLQEALDLTIDRFPFFNVSLRDGLFWNYFQALTEKPKVQEETENPCRPFVFKKNAHILRVLYYNTKISFEIFHSLSDGYGAIQFFNTLIITYLELMGIEIKDKAEYGYNVYDKPTKEEGEDSFKRYARKDTVRSRIENKGYAIEDECLSRKQLKVFNCTTSVHEAKEVAKKYGITLNEFLAAVYLNTLLEHKRLYGKNSKKPVKLSIPVNIRKHLPSKTMRNFALVLNIEIPLDKEDATFEEIIEIVKNDMNSLNEEYVLGFIGKNVRSETNAFVRIIPLFIKKPIMRLVYSQVGEILFTSTLTNMGLNKLPSAVIDNIECYQTVLGATKLNRINLAVISVGDTLTITISSRLKENTVVKDFYKRLADFGLNLNLHSNV